MRVCNALPIQHNADFTMRQHSFVKLLITVFDLERMSHIPGNKGFPNSLE